MQAAVDERGIRKQLHTRVEEEDVVRSRPKARSARLEAPAVGLGNDAGGTRPSALERAMSALPLRAVVDEHELGLEAAAFDRRRQGVDRPGEVGSLVEDRHDDTERVT